MQIRYSLFSKLFVFSLGLMFFAGLIAPANAVSQGVVQWTYSQFNDEANRGRMTSQLFIGVPETDDSMGFGTCFAGSTAGLPRLSLFAEADRYAKGQEVAIDFVTDSGPMRYSGIVNADGTGEMFPTVSIDLDMNDPLWSVMQRMSSIRYNVGDFGFNLPLRGSSRAISAFLADCRIYHGDFNPNSAGGNGGKAGQAVAADNLAPQPFDPRWASCDTLGNEISRNSDTPVTLTFVNRSDGYRSVFWIGFDGQPKEYANLNQGESYTINTFLTHPWMITDGPGNCLEMMLPAPGRSVFNITAPNRDFGPE